MVHFSIKDNDIIEIKGNYEINKLVCNKCISVFDYPTFIMTTVEDPITTKYNPSNHIAISGHIETDDLYCPKCGGKLLVVNAAMIYAIQTLCASGNIVKNYYGFNISDTEPYGYIQFEETVYRYLIYHNIKAPEHWRYQYSDTSLRPCIPNDMLRVSPEMHQCLINEYTTSINAWAENLVKIREEE